MINFTFNTVKNQLDVVYSNTVTLIEILDYIESIENDISLPRRLKIYTLALNIEMDFNPEDLYRIVDAVQKSTGIYETMIDAFVVDKTKETAFSTLFSTISKRDNYQFKVFSTAAAAQEWMKRF